MLLMEVRQDLWLKDSLRERELIKKRHGALQEARYTSIRTIMELASMMKWDLQGIDVKTSFLNGVIEEEVHIEQPQLFEVEDRTTHVCKLKKDLYGLKQAPRAWYGRIDSFLTSMGFTKSKDDHNLYTWILWMMNQSSYYYMWMIYFWLEMRNRSQVARRS